MKDEAMKLALEALETCGAGHITDGGNQWHDEKLVDKAITAIKQARALDKMADNARELGLDYEPAPVQEPVLWLVNGVVQVSDIPTNYTGCLYTTPPAAQRQWVGLTDEEVGDLSDFAYANDEEFVRNVEAKLKEKNA